MMHHEGGRDDSWLQSSSLEDQMATMLRQDTIVKIPGPEDEVEAPPMDWEGHQ